MVTPFFRLPCPRVLFVNDVTGCDTLQEISDGVPEGANVSNGDVESIGPIAMDRKVFASLSVGVGGRPVWCVGC